LTDFLVDFSDFGFSSIDFCDFYCCFALIWGNLYFFFSVSPTLFWLLMLAALLFSALSETAAGSFAGDGVCVFDAACFFFPFSGLGVTVILGFFYSFYTFIF
jgi:hypothetical protein